MNFQQSLETPPLRQELYRSLQSTPRAFVATLGRRRRPARPVPTQAVQARLAPGLPACIKNIYIQIFTRSRWCALHSTRADASRAELLHVTVRAPCRGDGLPLRVEIHTSLAVEVEVSQDRLLVAREREHGLRYRNRHPC